MSYKYNSPRYIKWRNTIFKRDSFQCRLCGKRGTINAHHIKRKADYPRLAYKPNNGICLCEKCHDIITGNELIFVKLFKVIVKEKLTTDYMFEFFSKLVEEHKDIVTQFKKSGKWELIPEMLSKLIILFHSKEKHNVNEIKQKRTRKTKNVRS